ncbi:MAG: DUF2272 domain-containing protein, partial [Pseudohongiellaceae bacterium]
RIKGSGFLIPGLLILAGALGSLPSLAQEPGHQSILQQPTLPRVEASLLPITPPEQRVSGTPGSLQIIERSCRSQPAAGLRERIVHTAVQEWAWFGFQVDDLRNEPTEPEAPGARPRWRLGLHPDEVRQVANTVGGYWAAIPGSDWILNRQNEAWQQPAGLSSRWRDPWSAAFISWVMCESGLDESSEFQRAIAHHTYIDQAIRARDHNDGNAAYHAFEPGEAEVLPGDLLCNGLRPMYRTLQQRRTQLGEGARTHCDIVVKVDAANGWILTIGGNVRASVRMKIHAAGIRDAGAQLAPLPARRPVFAHLKLRADTATEDPMLQSPTLQQLSCSMPEAPVTFEPLQLQLPAASC